jgi:hypothetical protein
MGVFVVFTGVILAGSSNIQYLDHFVVEFYDLAHAEAVAVRVSHKVI